MRVGTVKTVKSTSESSKLHGERRDVESVASRIVEMLSHELDGTDREFSMSVMIAVVQKISRMKSSSEKVANPGMFSGLNERTMGIDAARDVCRRTNELIGAMRYEEDRVNGFDEWCERVGDRMVGIAKTLETVTRLTTKQHTFIVKVTREAVEWSRLFRMR